MDLSTSRALSAPRRSRSRARPGTTFSRRRMKRSTRASAAAEIASRSTRRRRARASKAPEKAALRRARLDSRPAHGHHRPMSDDKSDPVDDLKQGLGLLFKAAKGAVEKLPT